jgi:DNA gyrase subunit A
VLPTKVPNLLINGASGIAVGMATNMLPHNLTEVVNGVIATLENPDITIEELMQFITAPDFPTGGMIYGYNGVRDAFHTGRGRVIVRGKAEIQTGKSGKETIIISEIPYQVNKASLVMKIADLVNDKKVIGISDVRDESDRTGMRIVVEVKRDAMANVILSQLFKYTPLQSSYGVNNIALVKGRPVLLNLKDMLQEFVEFRIEVIVRRTQYELRKAEERAHILEGLLIAIDNLDEVIKLIRASKTVEEAKNGLIARFELSEIQAKAILEMRLQKLTGLERDKVRAEFDELMKTITNLKEILGSIDLQKGIAKEELEDIKERYGDERRTEINLQGDGEINIEDLIADEEVIITISHLGYIKRTKSSEYRKQGRGGRGSRGSKTRDEDYIEHMFVATTHNYLLLFTENGRCHWLRVYEIPEATKTSSGRVIQNLLSIPKEDKVKAYIKIVDLNDEEFVKNNYIVFGTRKGIIKKTLVEAFSRPRANGINAITINEGDSLLEAKLTNGNSEILMAIKSGRAIRFNETNVRPMGRSAAGVRGIRLADENDEMVGLICVDLEDKETTIMVVSEKGNGKRTELEDYRVTNRGGKGVKTIQVTEKTGSLVALKAVKDEDDLIITSKEGIMIRIGVNEIRVMGRATQGVRVIRLDDKDGIADVAVISESEEEEIQVSESTDITADQVSESNKEGSSDEEE